jgi:hypothetical protein
VPGTSSHSNSSRLRGDSSHIAARPIDAGTRAPFTGSVTIGKTIEIVAVAAFSATAETFRSARPWVDIVLAGTAERAAYVAHQLCEQEPMLMKPYDHAIVLEPDQAATRGSGEPRRELIGSSGQARTAKASRNGTAFIAVAPKERPALLTARALTQRSTAQSVSGARQF